MWASRMAFPHGAIKHFMLRVLVHDDELGLVDIMDPARSKKSKRQEVKISHLGKYKVTLDFSAYLGRRPRKLRK